MSITAEYLLKYRGLHVSADEAARLDDYWTALLAKRSDGAGTDETGTGDMGAGDMGTGEIAVVFDPVTGSPLDPARHRMPGRGDRPDE